MKVRILARGQERTDDGSQGDLPGIQKLDLPLRDPETYECVHACVLDRLPQVRKVTCPIFVRSLKVAYEVCRRIEGGIKLLVPWEILVRGNTHQAVGDEKTGFQTLLSLLFTRPNANFEIFVTPPHNTSAMLATDFVSFRCNVLTIHLLSLDLPLQAIPSPLGSIAISIRQASTTFRKILACTPEASCVYFRDLDDLKTFLRIREERLDVLGFSDSLNITQVQELLTGSFWNYTELLALKVSYKYPITFGIAFLWYSKEAPAQARLLHSLFPCLRDLSLVVRKTPKPYLSRSYCEYLSHPSHQEQLMITEIQNIMGSDTKVKPYTSS